jgi:hypothetical protein
MKNIGAPLGFDGRARTEPDAPNGAPRDQTKRSVGGPSEGGWRCLGAVTARDSLARESNGSAISTAVPIDVATRGTATLFAEQHVPAQVQ